MGEFYIKQPDELYHYGVKGMRWGVRHDPERTGNGRGSSGSSKKMSTAKKVAIGAAAIAAVAGVSYVAVTRGQNKAAAEATKKAMRVMRKYSKTKIKRGPVNQDYYNVRARVRGHTQRVNEAARVSFKQDVAVKRGVHANLEYGTDAMGNVYIKSGDIAKRNAANKDWTALNKRASTLKSQGKSPAARTDKINKLRRQKGPKVLRYR